MRTSVLIFDFDGTIADTFDHALAIANRLADEFHFRKVAPHETEELRDKPSKEVVRYLQIPILKLPSIAIRAERELHKVIASVAPIKGLKPVLLQLRTMVRTMGILTSNSAENVHAFLRMQELECFDFVVTSSRLWGKARRLKRLMKERDMNPGSVLYVGDETRDIRSARKAGIRIAAVTWGYNSRATLDAYEPDYLAESPSDLLAICAE